MFELKDKEYLLRNDLARNLYHRYAERLPILDYHCHLSPEAIAEDRRFTSITELWLDGDHYKWRLMREHGIPERCITGDAEDREKFRCWIETLSLAIGNPLYPWSRMELERYFGWRGPIRAELANEIYEHCNTVIAREGLSARSLIRDSGVRALCTTDDPADDLHWHRRLREDATFETAVLPAYRPDRIMNLRKPDFRAYIGALGGSYGTAITSYPELLQVIRKSIERFDELGCCAADHGLDDIPFERASGEDADRILRKALAGTEVSDREAEQYQTKLLLDLAALYAEAGWALQLHYGAERNTNSRMFRQLGPDTGYDCISGKKLGVKLPALLNALSEADSLPKTIVYSLAPQDDEYIDTVINCMQPDGRRGWIQHGAAWWFNDHSDGIRAQLRSRANHGMVAEFIGMLTDSRSFLSYSRHDYFRRILCQLVSEWIEEGACEPDEEFAGEIIRKISCENAAAYFGLEAYLG